MVPSNTTQVRIPVEVSALAAASPSSNPTARSGSGPSCSAGADALSSYQLVVYNRPVHPELFGAVNRSRIDHPRYRFDCWLMSGQHVFCMDRGLESEHGQLSVCEVLSADEQVLPTAGLVAGFFCAGERDFSQKFENAGVEYMTTVQTETLSENLYHDMLREMTEYAAEIEAPTQVWRDDAGDCLSLVETFKMAGELHAQSYHLIARGGLVIRTQTIFELL